MSFLLAAIQTAPPPGDAPPAPAIRDIQPPIDPPWPLWLDIAVAALAILVLAFVVWRIVHWAKHRPAPIPLTPRAIALRELERLRAQIRVLDPYQFSIAVSDVLRHFIGAHFGLHAEQQTSPEFLESIRRSFSFTEDDRHLLANFLERCDLVKFARMHADETTSEALLGSALAFAQGART